MNDSRRGAWLGTVLLVLVSVLVVAAPVFLIRPFAPQTPGALDLAFTLRRLAPGVTLGALAGVLLLVWRLRPSRPGLLRRSALVAAVILGAGGAWMARQNHFEWMFAPLPDARFVRAASADFVRPDDMVLAVTLGGDAAAYPVNQLAYHHLVEDAVGGVPIVATY